MYMTKGMTLMLLLSLPPKHGLCSSIRLILSKATSIFLHCEIATGDNAREEELIHRIEIRHQDEQFIEWNGRQFQVKPDFAMIINKWHDRTLKKVGVWLEETTFTHALLYVTVSRVGNPQHPHSTVDKSACIMTRNVVCKDDLLMNKAPLSRGRVDKKEETLPHSTRRKLSQLRTNKSPLLMTYLHKIDPANHPAANCPLCNDPNHDSLHLFNCPDIPTTLTVWDLWTNPVGVAVLLDVWGEKLGGPRAGVWDPVRAHARDGVDTTTTTTY